MDPCRRQWLPSSCLCEVHHSPIKRKKDWHGGVFQQKQIPVHRMWSPAPRPKDSTHSCSGNKHCWIIPVEQRSLCIKNRSSICNSLRSSQPTMEHPDRKIVTRSWRATTLKTCAHPEHDWGRTHRHSTVEIKSLFLLFEIHTMQCRALSITGHTDRHILRHELNMEPATRTHN